MFIGIIILNIIEIKYCKRLKIVCVNMNIGTKHFFCQLPSHPVPIAIGSRRVPIANFSQPKNTPLPIDAPHCIAQFFANNSSHLLQTHTPFDSCCL